MMIEVLEMIWGNVLMINYYGCQVKQMLEDLCYFLVWLINVQFDDEIVIISGGIESDNMVVKQVVKVC